MKRQNRNPINNVKNGSEDFPLLDMLSQLPSARAPRDFESVLYRRLGITYFPLHRKIAILSSLCVFAGSIYLAGRWLLGMLMARVTLAGVAQWFSITHSKIMQTVSIIKVGYHLKEILVAFANPWFFVGVAFVSSGLMLILIAIVKNGKRGAVLLSNH